MAIEKLLAIDASGNIVEKAVEAGGSGGSGVTAANFVQQCILGGGLLNYWSPRVHIKDIGIATMPLVGVLPAAGPDSYSGILDAAEVSGTGAAVTYAYKALSIAIGQSIAAGTTATGRARGKIKLGLGQKHPIYVPYGPFSYSSDLYPQNNPDKYFGIGFQAQMLAMPTSGWTAEITLFGEGAPTNVAFNLSYTGIVLRQTYSTNATIVYNNGSETLASVVLPFFIAASAPINLQFIYRPFGELGTLEVYKDRILVTTITDIFQTGASIMANRIMKTSGTAAVTMLVYEIAIAESHILY